jgi:type VI secretion system protein ImpB
MAESVHKKLARVRKPRVHITYDVETEGATRQKELPFVVGVMGDFSGEPTAPLKPLKDRKFVQIDRDNFDAVMASMTPGLKLKVENTLADDGSELAVDLQFKSMEDFSPINLVQQIDPLRKLYETREKLKELQSKVDRSDELQGVLEDVLRQTASLQQIASELGVGEAGAPSDSSDEPSAAQPQGDAE